MLFARFFGAIEIDTLTKVVWEFNSEEDIFDIAKDFREHEKKPLVIDVYPKYKKNVFIYTNQGIIEVTPLKEIVWKLEADEGLKDILGIKFFRKGLNNYHFRMYHLAGIVEN